MKNLNLTKSLILGAAVMALASTSALAQTSTTVVQHQDGTTTTKTVEKDKGGTVPGAVGGAIAGALVAGPVGLVVGGVAGATLGHSVAPPSEVRTYVTTQDVEPVRYEGKIEMGKTVDGELVWREVPAQPKYHWAYLNGQKVVVDDRHTVVAVY